MREMFEGCETLEDTVHEALLLAKETDYPEDLNLIELAFLVKIRGWMDDIANTIMDGPGSLPETVKAEEARQALWESEGGNIAE